MRTHWLLLALFTTVLLPTTLFAQVGIPDPSLCTATSASGNIYITPAGNGQSLGSIGGITVTLVDFFGNPIPSYPRADIWLEGVNPGEVHFCTNGNFADTDTDANGQTTFTGNLLGGGHTLGGLRVYVSGAPITGSPALDININSPDINGDLAVDLCDIVPFAQDYGSTISFRSDLNHDGVVDLLDAGIFSTHVCEFCPGEPPPGGFDVSGEIGVFFDAAGTQTGIEGVAVGIPFNFYVVAFDATGGIAGYKWGITTAVDILLINVTYNPSSTFNFGSGVGDTYAGTGGPCLPETGSVVLATYQAILVADVSNASICMGPSIAGCDHEPDGPAYLTCSGACDWRVFAPAYQGCAIVNGEGPIATTPATWGTVKALYGD